jgi:UDP-N-acetyl-2-amino-2-deoxyglucuronate dehydrogenase
MSRRRIALIGLGMAVTPHAKSLMDLRDRVEVVHAFSPSAARREAFAKHFAFPLGDRLETILDNDSIGAVAILTPPNTHLDLVRRCADAGKHILLEKPLETTTARAVELVETCRRTGLKLGIVLQHRFRPAAMKLAELMAQGELGGLVGCSTSIRLWRPQSYYDVPGRGVKARDGGGVLLTQGIHTLDLMLSLAGPVSEVTGYAATTPVHRMETEDLVCAAARFANGAYGTIDATTAAYPGFAERIEMIFRNGSASLAGTALDVRYEDGRTVTVASDDSAGGTGADPMAFPHDYHRAVWTDFLNALERGGEPKVTGKEALKVHRLIDALIETGARGAPVLVEGT